MSAFGQAGFGSSNRRRQLQAQGQMDPYGQQVRAAKQAPTFSIYQTQRPAQQPAQQQAKPPATPAAPAMPAYSTGQTAQPTATPGTAQPIQPQTQGTPYSPQAISPGQATASPGATDYSHMRGVLPQNVDPARWDELAKGGAFGPDALNWIQHTRMVEAEHLRLNALRGHPGDEGEALWRQQQEVEATVKQQKEPLARQQNANAYNSMIASNPRLAGLAPGQAQPIQPQSQGTPYGADPGYADRVSAAAQQWNSTPAGSQQFGNWQNNPSAVARERQQEMAARNAERAAAGLASDQLTQQANNTERLYVQDGFAQRQFERDGQNVTELAPSYRIGGLGTEHLPRYRRLPDGTMQRVDQADRAPVGGWGAPGQAQPIQPQSQGTPYGADPGYDASVAAALMRPGSASGYGNAVTGGTPTVGMHNSGTQAVPGTGQQPLPFGQSMEYYYPPSINTAAMAAAAKEKAYQDSVNAIRGRINAANAGLLGRYIGDGVYEYDYMLKGYGGDVDPATLSFSLVGSPKRT